MHLPPDSIVEDIMFFKGRFVVPFVQSNCSFVHLSGQILLPRYLINGLNSFDKTGREYSLAHTDDLIRFWRS